MKLTRSPFHKRFHHHNSNSMETQFMFDSTVGYHIATKFCTWHDSYVVMPCAKFHSDHFIIIWMRVEWNFHRIWTTMEEIICEMGPWDELVQKSAWTQDSIRPFWDRYEIQKNNDLESDIQDDVDTDVLNTEAIFKKCFIKFFGAPVAQQWGNGPVATVCDHWLHHGCHHEVPQVQAGVCRLVTMTTIPFSCIPSLFYLTHKYTYIYIPFGNITLNTVH